ncbi:MAG: hypothetical protein KDE03_02345 [Rhodobacteraceae bacterium]|nr:hypothetical protein [Paracoccaceae bacterium]
MAETRNDVALRNAAKLHLITNPNYFGNLTDLKLAGIPKAVLKKVGDTSFEQLTCIGYNPDTEILTAIVRIKQQTGYGGDACSDGSDEFVRFYLDYGDGSWVDHGVASFNIHDLPFKDPLCYAVSVHIRPKRRSCCDDKPVLPKVRAILSWNTMPPANMPNWVPVWGNRLERDIQIEPRNWLICKLTDKITDIGIQKIDPALIDKITAAVTKLPSPKPDAALPDLLRSAPKADALGVLRNVFPAVAKLAADPTDIAAYQALSPLKAFDIDLSEFADFLAQPNFNTTYEELHCVGLDRDRMRLHGVVQIKRQSGYSGNLCQKGSREYIAFYLDFGSGWEYQGTTFVEVHDVDVPQGGLWYQASLPVNLDKHRQEWCKTGRARIRGILSWAVPPAPNQPDFVPHWGDREDCWIEVESLPEGVTPGIFTPILESIGNMVLPKINGAGYANGSSVGGLFIADDAPFGGRTLLKGNGFNIPPGPMEYRVMIQGPSDAAPRAWTVPFDAEVTTFPSIFPVTQTVNATGDWFPWLAANPLVSVADNLLAALTGLENGLHTVYLEFRHPFGAVLAATPPKAFMVDNTGPVADIEITSGAGNCGKFGIGEVISGTYSMTGDHAGSLVIHVTPLPEAAGGTMVITSAVPGAFFAPPFSGGNSSVSLSYAGLTLNTDGTSGTWELDTTGMEPCGYNLRIHVRDRTIVGSGSNNWTDDDIEGFCLEQR